MDTWSSCPTTPTSKERVLKVYCVTIYVGKDTSTPVASEKEQISAWLATVDFPQMIGASEKSSAVAKEAVITPS